MTIERGQSTSLASSSAGDDPLTSEHRRQLADADDRARGILRAAKVASFNGWTIGAAALISAMFAMFSVAGLIATIVLGAIAWNEFRGRSGLRRFDRKAAIMLGWNQVVFLMAIITYCVWSAYRALFGPMPMLTELSNSGLIDPATSGDVERLARLIAVMAYAVIAILSLAFQGLNAWYYFSRAPVIDAYVRETPPWVRELQAARA